MKGIDHLRGGREQDGDKCEGGGRGEGRGKLCEQEYGVLSGLAVWGGGRGENLEG